MIPPEQSTSEAARANAQAREVVVLEDVCFAWDGGETPDLVVEQLRIPTASRWFVGGESGSGKSTLLGLLAGVCVPQSGTLRVLGTDLRDLGAAQRDAFRADHVGYVFQLFNLIPYLSVIENVTLPLRFSPRRRRRVAEVESEARRLLERLGLEGELHRAVTKLSVGQQQRVAVARALIGSPELVLVDEPTSSLDAALSARFLELLFEECERVGATLVFVSHDQELAGLFPHRCSLEGGALRTDA